MQAKTALIAGAVCLLIGAGIGWCLRPVPASTIQYRDNIKERVITHTVREPNGLEVVVRDETRSTSHSEAKLVPSAPKPEYRIGVLLPIMVNERLPTVSASKRLFGNIWADAQFNTSTQEALVGVSVEF